MTFDDFQEIASKAGLHPSTKEFVNQFAHIFDVDYRTLNNQLTKQGSKSIPRPWVIIIQQMFEVPLLQQKIRDILDKLFLEVNAEHLSLLVKKNNTYLVQIVNTNRSYLANEEDNDNKKYWNFGLYSPIINEDPYYSLSLYSFLNGKILNLVGAEISSFKKEKINSRKHNYNSFLSQGISHSLLKIPIDIKTPNSEIAERFCLLSVENKLDSEMNLIRPKGNEKIFTFEDIEKLQNMAIDELNEIKEDMFLLEYHIAYPTQIKEMFK